MSVPKFIDFFEPILHSLSDGQALTKLMIKHTEINQIWKLQFPNSYQFTAEAFLKINFTHHQMILGKIKDVSGRIYHSVPKIISEMELSV